MMHTYTDISETPIGAMRLVLLLQGSAALRQSLQAHLLQHQLSLHLFCRNQLLQGQSQGFCFRLSLRQEEFTSKAVCVSGVRSHAYVGGQCHLSLRKSTEILFLEICALI